MRACVSLLLLTLAFAFRPAAADTASVAVAANFASPARAIAAAFDGGTRLSMGATGQLYLQISQGAPYDVFLAADQARPALALRKGYAVEDTGFTYALGRLALFSREPSRVQGPDSLRAQSLRKLAIANPATAPYGAAAMEVLEALGLETTLRPKLVQGKNVAQAYQFAAVGAADMSFVAASLLANAKGSSRWDVPATMHQPIAQDAVLLTRGQENPAAKAFLDFLKGPEALAIIRSYGYDAPHPATLPAPAPAPRKTD